MLGHGTVLGTSGGFCEPFFNSSSNFKEMRSKKRLDDENLDDY